MRRMGTARAQYTGGRCYPPAMPHSCRSPLGARNWARSGPVARLFICSLCLIASSCGGEAIGDQVDQAAQEAKAAARQAVDDAEVAAKRAASDAADSTKTALEAQSKRARDWVEQTSKNTDMSDQALEALKSAGSGVASLFESTTQMAPSAPSARLG